MMISTTYLPMVQCNVYKVSDKYTNDDNDYDGDDADGENDDDTDIFERCGQAIRAMSRMTGMMRRSR